MNKKHLPFKDHLWEKVRAYPLNPDISSKRSLQAVYVCRVEASRVPSFAASRCHPLWEGLAVPARFQQRPAHRSPRVLRGDKAEGPAGAPELGLLRCPSPRGPARQLSSRCSTARLLRVGPCPLSAGSEHVSYRKAFLIFEFLL